MKNKLVITKFAYLKTPLYTWTLQNEVGGSFSNSGMHKSRQKCFAHFEATHLEKDYVVIDEVVTDEEATI